MSQSIREKAVTQFKNYMTSEKGKGRGSGDPDTDAMVGVYKGTLRLERKHISAVVDIPTKPYYGIPTEVQEGLTLGPNHDKNWEKIKSEMTKWCKRRSRGSTMWRMIPSTIKEDNQSWSCEWKNNPDLAPKKGRVRSNKGAFSDIESGMKTEASTALKDAYIIAMDAWSESLDRDEIVKASSEYEHGTQREAEHQGPQGGPIAGVPPTVNKLSQAGSYTDIALSKAIKKAIFRNADYLKKDKKVFDNAFAIFEGFMLDYVGINHNLKKMRTHEGINDTLEVFAQITLDATSDTNKGDVNREIARKFKKTFDFTKAKPTQEFVKLCNTYLKGLSIDEIDELWTASDKPSISLQKIGKAVLGKGLGNSKNVKLSPELKKKFKPDKRRSKGRPTKTKRMKINSHSSGGISRAISKARAVTRHSNNPREAMKLKDLLNQMLPSEVLERMQAPSLINRTGRFKNSVEATNVMIGARGAMQVEYTYMKNPYKTFEPGGKQGSTNRDPRKIIGASIRDIMYQLTGKKFIRTRRV